MFFDDLDKFGKWNNGFGKACNSYAIANYIHWFILEIAKAKAKRKW